MSVLKHSRAVAGLALALLLIAGPTVHAQNSRNFQGGLHFLAGIPQGEFDDNLDNNAFGIGGQIAFSPEKSPFGIGISLGFMNYGTENRREPFSITTPDVTVKVTTTNNMFQGDLFLRAQYKQGDIRPYADGLVGLNYLWTETKISDASNGDDVASSKNFDDAVFSYGGGGGVMIRVYKGANSGHRFDVLLDIGARYMLGGEAEYLKKGSIGRDNGTVTYDVIQSKTDVLVVQIGVVANF